MWPMRWATKTHLFTMQHWQHEFISWSPEKCDLLGVYRPPPPTYPALPGLSTCRSRNTLNFTCEKCSGKQDSFYRLFYFLIIIFFFPSPPSFFVILWSFCSLVSFTSIQKLPWLKFQAPLESHTGIAPTWLGIFGPIDSPSLNKTFRFELWFQ